VACSATPSPHRVIGGVTNHFGGGNETIDTTNLAGSSVSIQPIVVGGRHRCRSCDPEGDDVVRSTPARVTVAGRADAARGAP
jgi:hypothetical protein